jgi:hypothetical protein
MASLKTKLLTAAALIALALPAHATTILTMGQTSGSDTITATANGAGTTTTITGTNVAIDITQIDAAVAVPTPALLDFNATSIGVASHVGSDVTQAFAGSFSITAGAVNYLSGTFTDAVFGLGDSLSLDAADPTEAVNFTSSVIPAFGTPRGLSLSFTDVTPGVSIDNATLASFAASISGNFSATQIPEPASLALLGLGLAGLGLVRRYSTT